MFILPLFSARLFAASALLVEVSTAGAVSAQENPSKPQEAPPKTQETSPRPEESILPPVVVTAPPPVSASSEVFIPGRDFELRPQGRPAASFPGS